MRPRQEIRSRGVILAAALLGGSILPPAASAGPRSVEAGGTGAYPTIQAAIDAAEPGDSVLVGPGTYRGEGNRDLSLGGKAIAVIGVAGPAETILDCEGSAGDPHRGFHLTGKEGPGSRIAGFTVTGGYVEGRFPDCYGGGILCVGSSPTIEDCWIIGNESAHFGGGMVCFESASPTLRRVRFIGNKAENNGGGLGSKMRCEPVLVDVLFAGNSAKRGGAFWALRAGAEMERATFYGNEASLSAGAIWANESDVRIRDSILSFTRNVEAIACTQPPTVRVKNSVVFGNEGGDGLPRCVLDQGGNRNVDPLFVDPDKGDFRLRPGSPCLPDGEPGAGAGKGIGARLDSGSGP